MTLPPDAGESGPPRVLVVSHNPFSDSQSNGKTLSSFFEDWDPDRLAQLFFTMDVPSFSVCRRFYRVTDVDVLMALLRRPRSPGPVSEANVGAWELQRATVRRTPGFRVAREIVQRRWPVALLVRSLVWGSRWDVPALDEWLDEVDPQVVLFQSSNSTFAFDIVAEICDRRGIPLVMETTDDYVTARRSLDPFAWVHHRQITRAYSAAVRRSHVVIAIGQKMAHEYALRFGGRYVVAMNSVTGLENQGNRGPDTAPVVMHFAGNLGLDRWRVLAALGSALDRLHAAQGIEARLEVFSLVEPGPAVLERLTASSRVTFRGSADAEMLAERRAASTVLVHVESFDRRNRHITRLSVSTKVPEYLASNRAVLAIGPADVASIEYLAEHDAAEVVTTCDVGMITAALVRLLEDAERRQALAQRGAELTEQFHLRPRIAAMVGEEIRAAARR